MEKVHSRRVQFKVESETLGSSEGEALSQTPEPGENAHGFDG